MSHVFPKGQSASIDEVLRSDLIVVGTGVAGLAAALGSAPRRVALLTKSRLGAGGSSPWAQGGIAVAVGPDDDPALHVADTLAAGAGLNDPEVVELLAEEGPRRIQRLIELGARFDREASGRLALGREAAHSRRRILHAQGDATGAEIVRALSAAVRGASEVTVHEGAFALELVREEGRREGDVIGVLAVHADGRRVLHRAPAVVLATGGLGRLYLHSTNPPESTGDGLAMAARAGAELVDVELVQFHPTALAAGDGEGAPLPLLTEALRGEGAVLVDERGRRFLVGEHPDAELAPRDVVARAIWRQLAGGGRAFLDATRAVGESFPARFPTVFALCRAHGLDPRREPLPVAPAAHYHMGGMAVDENGRTSLPGLWACGEAAATGAHGANRLASNSLLEALVFGARVAEDLRASRPRLRGARPDPRAWETAAFPGGEIVDPVAQTLAVRRLMWERVGLVRDEAGLTSALAELAGLAAGEAPQPRPALPAAGPSARELGEAANLLLAGRLVATAALARRESRGGHYRADYPATDPAWRRRLFATLQPDGEIALAAREVAPVLPAVAVAPALAVAPAMAVAR